MRSALCPECIGMCDPSKIILDILTEDDCYQLFKCPRCNKKFGLQEVEVEE